jgi:hypothetical protein
MDQLEIATSLQLLLGEGAGTTTNAFSAWTWIVLRFLPLVLKMQPDGCPGTVLLALPEQSQEGQI